MPSQLAHVAIERVAGLGHARQFDPAKQVVRRDLQRVGEPPKGVKGGLSGSRFEVRDGARGQLGVFGKLALAPFPQLFPGGAEANLKDFGRFLGIHGAFDMINLTGYVIRDSSHI